MPLEERGIGIQAASAGHVRIGGQLVLENPVTDMDGRINDLGPRPVAGGAVRNARIIPQMGGKKKSEIQQEPAGAEDIARLDADQSAGGPSRIAGPGEVEAGIQGNALVIRQDAPEGPVQGDEVFMRMVRVQPVAAETVIQRSLPGPPGFQQIIGTRKRIDTELVEDGCPHIGPQQRVTVRLVQAGKADARLPPAGRIRQVRSDAAPEIQAGRLFSRRLIAADLLVKAGRNQPVAADEAIQVAMDPERETMTDGRRPDDLRLGTERIARTRTDIQRALVTDFRARFHRHEVRTELIGPAVRVREDGIVEIQVELHHRIRDLHLLDGLVDIRGGAFIGIRHDDGRIEIALRKGRDGEKQAGYDGIRTFHVHLFLASLFSLSSIWSRMSSSAPAAGRYPFFTLSQVTRACAAFPLSRKASPRTMKALASQ